MQRHYSSIPSNTQSTPSVPNHCLKYRGLRYYSNGSEKPKEASPQKMTYRGVPYYKYGSEMLTIR